MLWSHGVAKHSIRAMRSAQSRELHSARLGREPHVTRRPITRRTVARKSAATWIAKGFAAAWGDTRCRHREHFHPMGCN